MELNASETSEVGRELNRLFASGEHFPVSADMSDMNLMKGRFTSIYFEDEHGVDHVLFGRSNKGGKLDYTPVTRRGNELPVPEEFKRLRDLAKAEWIYPGSKVKGVFIQGLGSYVSWLSLARQYNIANYVRK